jgi:hypothetical protein
VTEPFNPGSWRTAEAEPAEPAKSEDRDFEAFFARVGGSRQWARSEYERLLAREREHRELSGVPPLGVSRWAPLRESIYRGRW